jgi:hypothetical protein
MSTSPAKDRTDLPGAFALAYVFAPRVARLLAAMWTMHAISDAAQLAYSAAEERS